MLRKGMAAATRLLAIVVSAEKRLDYAILICKEALRKRPDDIDMMSLLAELYAKYYGPQRALLLWQAVLLELSNASVHTNTLVDQDFAGLCMLKAGRRLRKANSVSSQDNFGSVFSSMYNRSNPGSASSEGPSPQQQPHLHRLAKCWLQIAKCYLQLQKFDDCDQSINEARSIGVISADIECAAGMLADAQGSRDEAQQLYERALSIDPTHSLSLIQSGVGFLNDELLSNAEVVLKEAVHTDPYAHEAWSHLGTTMTKLGSVAAGEECCIAALDLESTMAAYSHWRELEPLR